MGRSGNIGWGISNYFKLPNRKKKLLTKEFLMDFRNDLINMQNEYDNKNGNITDWDKDGSYYGFFGEVASTYMFYDSLLRVCKKHNLVLKLHCLLCNLSKPLYSSFEMSLDTTQQNLHLWQKLQRYLKA